MTQNLERSFLARVPFLVEQGLSIDEAIQEAFRQEEKLIGEIYAGESNRARMVRVVLADSVYRREAEHRLQAELEKTFYGV